MATMNLLLSTKKTYHDCAAIMLSLYYSYTELVKLLLESGAAVDYRPDTGEKFPRTTLCDEPLRLAIRNKHYVSSVQNTLIWDDSS